MIAAIYTRKSTNQNGSSRPGESHPQALTEPDMNVSAHPALTVQPLLDATSASGQRAPGRRPRWPVSGAPSAGDAAASVNGFALSTKFLPSPVDLAIPPAGAAPSLQPHYRTFLTVGSEEAPIEGLASVRRSNGTCGFPAYRFHKAARGQRDGRY